MTYPHRIVGRDVAEYAAEHGGASFHFQTGKPVAAPGFMVSRDGSEERTASGGSPTPEEVQDYADKHAASVANDPEAAHGVWEGTQDVSRRERTGQEMRLEARKNLQEAAYALGSDAGPPTRINPRMTTDSLRRMNNGDRMTGQPDMGPLLPATGPLLPREREGALVLTNLRESGDAKGTRKFISMTKNESDSWRHPNNTLFAPTGNLNDISLNEVENDAYSMTNRNNKRGGSGRGPTPRADGLKKRIDLGDVLRTINYGRTQSIRGISMTAHPEKGWHEDTNAQGETVKPRKKRKNDDDGERSVVEYSPALEAERGGTSGYRPSYQATPAQWAEWSYLNAADLHRRLSPPRPPNTPEPPYEEVRQMVQRKFG